MSKGKLAILLSKLKTYKKARVKLEQYITPSEIAAEALWFVYLSKDIKDKTIIDLGCGTGILGIGALLLGAKEVYFVDKDKKALKIAEENLEMLFKRKVFKNHFRAVFINKDVRNLKLEKVNTVIENPPFGVQEKHADRVFLEKATELSDRIYSFHKVESEDFIRKFLSNFKIELVKEFEFVLGRSQKFHKKERYKVKVGFWKISKK